MQQARHLRRASCIINRLFLLRLRILILKTLQQTTMFHQYFSWKMTILLPCFFNKYESNSNVSTYWHIIIFFFILLSLIYKTLALLHILSIVTKFQTNLWIKKICSIGINRPHYPTKNKYQKKLRRQ
jgi:hypothetical protein